MGEFESEWMDVTSGVPQGSVLGPLLFLLFINDLPDLWINSSKLYADDSKIIGIEVNTNEGVQKVQADVDAASDWVDNWLMQLNHGKCAVMHTEYHIHDSQTRRHKSGASELRERKGSGCESGQRARFQ